MTSSEKFSSSSETLSSIGGFSTRPEVYLENKNLLLLCWQATRCFRLTIHNVCIYTYDAGNYMVSEVCCPTWGSNIRNLPLWTNGCRVTHSLCLEEVCVTINFKLPDSCIFVVKGTTKSHMDIYVALAMRNENCLAKKSWSLVKLKMVAKNNQSAFELEVVTDMIFVAILRTANRPSC